MDKETQPNEQTMLFMKPYIEQAKDELSVYSYDDIAEYDDGELEDMLKYIAHDNIPQCLHEHDELVSNDPAYFNDDMHKVPGGDEPYFDIVRALSRIVFLELLHRCNEVGYG